MWPVIELFNFSWHPRSACLLKPAVSTNYIATESPRWAMLQSRVKFVKKLYSSSFHGPHYFQCICQYSSLLRQLHLTWLLIFFSDTLFPLRLKFIEFWNRGHVFKKYYYLIFHLTFYIFSRQFTFYISHVEYKSHCFNT